MKKRDFSPLRTMSSIGSRLLKLCLLWIFSLSSLVIQAQDAQRISVDLRGETLKPPCGICRTRQSSSLCMQRRT